MGAACRSKHRKALWTADSDGAAGRTGRRSSVTSEADHVGDHVGDHVTTNVLLQITQSTVRQCPSVIPFEERPMAVRILCR